MKMNFLRSGWAVLPAVTLAGLLFLSQVVPVSADEPSGASPAASATAVSGPVATKGAAGPAAPSSDATSALKLSLNKATTVDLPGPVADILVANPAVADVGVLRSDKLYVIGRSVGSTNVLAFDETGGLLSDIAIHVRVDEKTIRDTLRDFFPKEDLSVRTVNEDVVLTGMVSNPNVANQVRDMASRFVDTSTGKTVVDLMTVKGEQQVMLKVRVLEANRNALREYGVSVNYKESKTAQSGARYNGDGGIGISEDPFGLGTIFFEDNAGFGPLQMTLQALEEGGLINTLAEPNLTAISGETAGFLAGGEFPVPVGRDQDGNITIEFKKFGVALNFTPVVLSRDRISLHLAAEVSALDQQNGITLVGVDVPGLSVRRAETTVELGSGGSMMIAGLIKSETAHTINGLPGAQDLPILGELFKSKSFQRDETELVVMVTPYLVKPMDKAEADLVTADEKRASPLAKSFADNIQNVYGKKAPANLAKSDSFGYLVD